MNGRMGDFETFRFGPEFSDLLRGEIPERGWPLDNLVFQAVPEPSPAALLVWGGVWLLLTRQRRGSRRPA